MEGWLCDASVRLPAERARVGQPPPDRRGGEWGGALACDPDDGIFKNSGVPS